MKNRVQREYRKIQMDNVEDVAKFTEGYFLQNDANDLLGMLWTSHHADISPNARFNGDFAGALRTIRARAIVPCETDFTFACAAISSNLQSGNVAPA